MANLKRDIARYLNGELTPPEMHALEKRALDDPFLAEALEGSTQIEPVELTTDLAKLRTLLEERVQGKAGKVIPFWVWPARIAAGLLVIVIATFVIISLSTDRPSETLAVNKETTPLPEADEKDIPSPTETKDEENKNLLSLAKPEESKSKSLTPTSANKQDVAGNPTLATLPPVQEAEPEVAAELLADDDKFIAEAVEETTVQTLSPQNIPQIASKRSESNAFSERARESDRKTAAGASTDRVAVDEVMNSKIIKGQVKSEDGAGLPGVNVMIKGTNIGAVTNIAGNYQIGVDERNVTLIFSSIGFASEEIDPGEQDQVNVQLSQDVSQLSEVVVVGYGAERETDDGLVSKLELATPAGGQRAYKIYLENNLRYPAEALENSVEGKVTIQFTVEPSGQLTDFSVVRGIGNGCDEEVIRLIREGPTWTPTRRNNTSLRDKVNVRLKFALPKK